VDGVAGVEGVDGVELGGGFVVRGVDGVDGVACGAGAGVEFDGTWTFGILLLLVEVEDFGVVVVEAGGVVAVGGGVVAAGGGVWATWPAAAVWLGGTVWSSLRAAKAAATAPPTSSRVRPSTAIAERSPGRSPRRPAAVPH
jgi:hypothetical protein